MRIYLTDIGSHVTLDLASSLRAARSAALKEHGTRNVTAVRLATEADIEWVRGMGGRVPKVPPRVRAPKSAAKGGQQAAA